MKRTETPSATHRLMPWSNSLSTHDPPQAARDRSGHGAGRNPGALHRGHRRAAMEHIEIRRLNVAKGLAINIEGGFHGKSPALVEQRETRLRLLIIAARTLRFKPHQLPERVVAHVAFRVRNGISKRLHIFAWQINASQSQLF